MQLACLLLEAVDVGFCNPDRHAVFKAAQSTASAGVSKLKIGVQAYCGCMQAIQEQGPVLVYTFCVSGNHQQCTGTAGPPLSFH